MGTKSSKRALDAHGSYGSIQRSRSGSVDSDTGHSMTCPTCHGKGTVDIKPGQTPEQLVALIPYGDKRLKPRRTKLYVGVTVVVCAVISGLLAFFLLPRSVTLQLTEPHMIGYSEVGNYTVLLGLNFTLSITNDNYLAVTVGSMEITVSETSVLLGGIEVKNSSSSVSMRSTAKYVHEVVLTFNGSQGLNIRRICAGHDWRQHKLNVVFQEMVTYTFLTSTENLVNVDYYLINCVKPGTTTPPQEAGMNPSELQILSELPVHP